MSEMKYQDLCQHCGDSRVHHSNDETAQCGIYKTGMLGPVLESWHPTNRFTPIPNPPSQLPDYSKNRQGLCSVCGVQLSFTEGTFTDKCDKHRPQLLDEVKERAEACSRCGKMVTDWVDPDWAHGRICLDCDAKYDPESQLSELRAESERLRKERDDWKKAIGSLSADKLAEELVELRHKLFLREATTRSVWQTHEKQFADLTQERDSLRARVAALEKALQELADAVAIEVDRKGGGGFILARLTDARAALNPTISEGKE